MKQLAAQMAAPTLCLFALAYSRAALGPIQETLSRTLGLDDNRMALLQGLALSLPFILLGVPLGHLIDRTSRTKLLTLFVVMGLAGSVLTAFAPGFWLLFVGRCLVGLAAMAAVVTAMSLVADLFPSGQRGRAIMVLSVAQIVGGAGAFALGGALLPVGGAETGWRTTALAPVVMLAGLLLLASAMREPARQAAKPAPPLRANLADLRQAGVRIAPLLAGALVIGVADGASLVWAAPNFTRRFGLEPGMVGMIVGAAMLVSGLVGPILGGVIADASHKRGGPVLTLWIMALLSAASALAGLFAIAPGPALSAVLLAVFLTLGGAIGVGYLAVFTIVVPEGLRALCIATGSVVGALFGIGVAPLTVSAIASAGGDPRRIGEALSIVCVVSSLIAAVAFVLVRRLLPAPRPE